MSEFEKELEKNMKLNKVAYEIEGRVYGDFLVSKRDIERVFHDWQPPKQLVVVPQFVADAIESLSNGIRGAYDAIYLIKCKVEQYRELNTDWLYVYDWIFEKGNSTIFEKAFLEGYTVKEEQLYEVIISGFYLVKVNKFRDSKRHVFCSKYDLCNWAETGYKLTEQQIKAIDEQFMSFAVKVEE